MPIREYGGYGERPDPLSLFFDPTEEQTIRMREWIYMVSNVERVRKHYASHIFEELIAQNSALKKQIELWGFSASPIKIIEEYIIFCGDFEHAFFVLCHPTTKEPCVVVDAYDFFPTKQHYSRQEWDLFNHVQGRYTEEAFLSSPFAKEVGKAAGKEGLGHALTKGGKYLSHRGERLQAMARHYSSPHTVNKRVTRSIRGKAAQQKAFAELFKKANNYERLARRYTNSGKILGALAKQMKGSSFSFFSVGDALTPYSTSHGASNKYNDKQLMKISIDIELDTYCKKNNNYNQITKQTYFEPL